MNDIDMIALAFLKYVAPFGNNAGRYIWTSEHRNQIIDLVTKPDKIDDETRNKVETKLKSAWAIIANQRA